METWRDETISPEYLPVPPVGEQGVGSWEAETLHYFYKSKFYSTDSLTEMYRRGVDMGMLLATRTGKYYQLGVRGGMAVVTEVLNHSEGGKAVRQESLRHFIIRRDGVIIRAGTVQEITAAVLRNVAKSTRKAQEEDLDRLLESIKPDTTLPLPTVGDTPIRVHQAGVAVRTLVAQVAHALDVQQQQAVAAQQQLLAKRKRDSETVSFTDPSKGSHITLTPGVGCITYAVDGEARPPVTKVLYSAKKNLLKFPEVKKAAALPTDSKEGLVREIERTCQAAGVTFTRQK